MTAQHYIPFKIKLALVAAILFWASAFVAIRAGLQGYSPQGLALLRFLIASVCMLLLYFRLPERNRISTRDKLLLLLIGAIGVGCYNITLNLGELSVPSGMSSFIISQSPVITTLFAVVFLSERFNLMNFIGMLVSISGVFMILIGETHGLHFSIGMIYILIATVVGGFYSVLQKPFLKKYHAIEVTTYIILGATLMLLMFSSHLVRDLSTASFSATLATIYLGIFPAAVAYVLWSYVLAMIPASRAVSFLYFMPVIATLLGWALLNEVPMIMSLIGGLIALLGVWLVNQSYRIAR
jgi:drug/metabolite transporter (DMT)-like permease